MKTDSSMHWNFNIGRARRPCRAVWEKMAHPEGSPYPVEKSYPEIIDIQLTYLCNLRCKMCGQWGAKGLFINKVADLRRKELDAEAWIKFFSEISPHRPEILLWGGEPLLRDDFSVILATLGKLGLATSIVTNGTLLKEHAAALTAPNVRVIYLSLDGDARHHDAIRGRAGTFRQIAEGVKALRKARGKGKRPFLIALTTMQRDNEEILASLGDVAAELGIDRLIYSPLMFIEQDRAVEQREYIWRNFGMEWKCSASWDVGGLGVNPEIVQPILDSLPRIHCGVELETNLPKGISLRQWHENTTDTGGRKCCRVPWKKMNVMPNGDCNFCNDFPDYIIGNIREQGVAGIWNGDKAARFRRALETAGPSPVCRRCIWLYNDFAEPSAEEGKRGRPYKNA